jgi:hypothetical protein
MKVLTGALVALMLFSAAGADAWPWKRAKKRPEPIDSPIVRPKNKNLGRPKTTEHKSVHDKHNWGAEERLLRLKDQRDGNHSIYND